ncbi:MAG: DNA-directed RNA polymerase, subunit E'' [Candidatus Diapherotrites archaeon]|uniref:Transcription elongation factor Spt4 n=1 Tax=Candidatus Iainarchaeum sp. TaxID=3101447 RepID=A0A938YWZ7_9ARCH|nr:DNA-directed RNA polymerase, subunit E'' [Candidatus Diapherotrites archaeon]
MVMVKEKACRNCRMVVMDETTCPNCGGTTFTTFWRGYVVIVDPEKSEIANRMGIQRKGKFALRLSR